MLQVVFQVLQVGTIQVHPQQCLSGAAASMYLVGAERIFFLCRRGLSTLQYIAGMCVLRYSTVVSLQHSSCCAVNMYIPGAASRHLPGAVSRYLQVQSVGIFLVQSVGIFRYSH